MTLTWCDISVSALRDNIQALREHLGPQVLLAPAVKGNAYGHGLVLSARTMLDAGANWLCVNALYEAATLREAGITCPLYLVGYIARQDLPQALALGCDLVLYNSETLDALIEETQRSNLRARVHLKLETGNNRQGLLEPEALTMARRCHAATHIELVGLSSHYANVEDTTDHSYALEQLARFTRFAQSLEDEGIHVPMHHMSNSAAAILWPERAMQMARVGIAAYGMWPSSETLVATLLAGKKPLTLRPALAWRCRIAQIKTVAAGEFIGYGCTYRTTHPTRLAILPVGYYDGYDRKLSNQAHVLIGGMRAPVRGRVCMNITMVDVTDIPEASLEQEVTLLGRDGDEEITAETLAGWAQTINYEITTRINDRIPRIACS